MVRGTQADRERAIGRALEVGITYFDTARSSMATAFRRPNQTDDKVVDAEFEEVDHRKSAA